MPPKPGKIRLPTTTDVTKTTPKQPQNQWTTQLSTKYARFPGAIRKQTTTTQRVPNAPRKPPARNAPHVTSARHVSPSTSKTRAPAPPAARYSRAGSPPRASPQRSAASAVRNGAPNTRVFGANARRLHLNSGRSRGLYPEVTRRCVTGSVKAAAQYGPDESRMYGERTDCVTVALKVALFQSGVGRARWDGARWKNGVRLCGASGGSFRRRWTELMAVWWV